LKRSSRIRLRPDYLVKRVSFVKEEPVTAKEVLDSHHCEKWKEAMAAEMQSLQDKDVWELIDMPQSRHLIGC